MKIAADSTACPVHKALSILQGKWKLLILYQIGADTVRYAQLRHRLPDITEKILIEELKELVANGLLSKKTYAEAPPRVEYSLTERGQRVFPVIEQLRSFGELYSSGPGKA